MMTSRIWVAEVVGGGPAEADGDDGLVVSAAEPDEPDVPGGPPAAAGAAVVDLDEQRLVGVGRALAVGLGAAGGGAVEPGPAAGVAHDGLGAAGTGAELRGRGDFHR